MQCYRGAAGEAANKDGSFLDDLEHVLAHERDIRQVRSRQTLVRMAGFPAIKTLDDYDYSFAVGAPKKLIEKLSWPHYGSSTNARTLCCWARLAWARRIWPLRWAMPPPKPGSRRSSSQRLS